MKKLEVRTRKTGFTPSYKTDLNDVIVFLRHSNDKITVINGETIQIEVYDNDELIFIGDKHELFEILKSNFKTR